MLLIKYTEHNNNIVIVYYVAHAKYNNCYGILIVHVLCLFNMFHAVRILIVYLFLFTPCCQLIASSHMLHNILKHQTLMIELWLILLINASTCIYA